MLRLSSRNITGATKQIWRTSGHRSYLLLDSRCLDRASLSPGSGALLQVAPLSSTKSYERGSVGGFGSQDSKGGGVHGDNTIQLRVNDISVTVPAGSTLLDAVKACGAKVPTLCYNPRYKAHASCRMCLVNVAGSPRPVPSCATPAQPGQEVTTDDPALESFRRADLQMILARHPNECMRCEVISCDFKSV
jgi:hypothetical protein